MIDIAVKKRGRPPGSKNRPKVPRATLDVKTGTIIPDRVVGPSKDAITYVYKGGSHFENYFLYVEKIDEKNVSYKIDGSDSYNSMSRDSFEKFIETYQARKV